QQAAGTVTSLNDVRRGLTPSDGIVMFFRNPHSGELLAAVMVGGAPTRLVTLPGLTGEPFLRAVARLQDDIDTETPRVWSTLKQVSDVLWIPLFPLPENITIALNPAMLGIPFEALPLPSGQPTATRHRVRYSFGLTAGMGK